MREHPPLYSIRIESGVTGVGNIATIAHVGPLAPLIAGLLEKHDHAKARVEAADARKYTSLRKPRGFDLPPEPAPHDENGGL